MICSTSSKLFYWLHHFMPKPGVQEMKQIRQEEVETRVKVTKERTWLEQVDGWVTWGRVSGTRRSNLMALEGGGVQSQPRIQGLGTHSQSDGQVLISVNPSSDHGRSFAASCACFPSTQAFKHMAS